MTPSLRRFRMLLPQSSALIAFVTVYVLANVPLLAAGPNPGAALLERLTLPRRGVLILGLLGYGAYRALAFHPFFRAGYRAWLETTPWTWRKPLPGGPVRPVWEDAAILSTLCAPAWYLGDLPLLAPVTIALGSYLTLLSLTFGRTGAWGFQWAVLPTVALALRLWEEPAWVSTGLILLAAVIALVGLGRSLKRWPWSLGGDLDPNHLETAFRATPAPDAIAIELGWPFDRLGPRRDAPPSWREQIDGVFASLVVGLWLYAGMGLIRDPQGRASMGFVAVFYGTLIALGHRVARYLVGYASPIGLGARLATFRWIIPSYDQVFLSPLAALSALSVCPFALYRAGLAIDASLSISFALALICLWVGGPDRRRWQLTARHRVVPAISSQARTKGGFIQAG